MHRNKKTKILFIVLPYLAERDDVKSTKLRSFKAFPYGVLSIATYLKKLASDKAETEVLDCNTDYGEDFMPLLEEKLESFRPDVVGLSMMFDVSYKHVGKICDIIKKHNQQTIITMGGMASIFSCDIILKEQKDIDAICYYEGEIPYLEMIKSKDVITYLETNASWITRRSQSKKREYQKMLVQNLDDVIDIDYSFVDISSYAMEEGFSPFASKIKEKKQFFLVTSRGCPFRCVFCMHSADKDKSIRYASVDAIIKHVRFLVKEYGMNVLTIYDDQILLNKERAKELFSRFAEFKLRIECPNGLSVAFLDDELIGLMKKAGMDTAHLAIESGSPYVLNGIIHKPLRLEMVKPAVEKLRKHGFWVQGYFVNGLPGEKDEHREETAKFIKDVGLDWSGFSLAVPIRGSELYRICVEKKYIKKEEKIDPSLFHRYVINTPDYSPEYVTKKTYMMNLDVNFVSNFRMKNGEYQIAADAFRDVIRRYGDHAFAYYFLSKSLSAIQEKEKAKNALNKFYEIINKDKVWMECAKQFNLK